jgi:hypothetical protein
MGFKFLYNQVLLLTSMLLEFGQLGRRLQQQYGCCSFSIMQIIRVTSSTTKHFLNIMVYLQVYPKTVLPRASPSSTPNTPSYNPTNEFAKPQGHALSLGSAMLERPTLLVVTQQINLPSPKGMRSRSALLCSSVCSLISK